MLKVKILERRRYSDLQDDVNEFLSDYKIKLGTITIVDIKYSSTYSHGGFYYSAMIVYKKKD